MMRNIILFTIIVMVIGCTDRNTSTLKLKNTVSESILLNGDILLSDSLIPSTRIVASFGDNIVIRSYGEGDILTVYRYDQGKVYKEGSLARKGSGPYEFSGAVECYVDNEHYQMYLFGITGGNEITAYKINLAEKENLYDIDTWEQITLPKSANSFFNGFSILSEDTLLALGGDFDSTSLLSVLHINSSFIKEIPAMFPEDNINVPTSIKRFIYNEGEILSRPSTDQFLYYCTHWGNYAEVITFSDNTLVNRILLSSDYPIYKTAPDGINSESTLETLMGMRASVTDNYIYLLPNFRTKKEFLAGSPHDSHPNDHAHQIYVFDWEGNFIARYDIDIPLSTFTVASDDSYIIGSSAPVQKEDVELVRYNIR